MRLERDTNDPAVEVRVKDQAGELRVSVRTPDGALADAMREGLPELVERLDRRGFHTEVWRPGAHEPATGSGRSGLRAPEAESSPGGGFSRDNGGSRAQTGDGREDEPQPSSEEWETAWLASRRSADRRRSSWQLR